MRYRDLIESKRFTDHIHNGHILVYTRVNPETGEIAPNFRCVGVVGPFVYVFGVWLFVRLASRCARVWCVVRARARVCPWVNINQIHPSTAG